VLFEFKSGALFKFSVHEACDEPATPWEVELYGTNANLQAREGDYRIVPSRPGQFQTWEREEVEEQMTVGDLLGDPQKREDSTANLVRNFLDCVTSRKAPLCPLEEGHRSTTFALIANIALARQKRLEWDADREEFTNDQQANEMLHYEYRSPWTLR
jgi:predicted dehydrogenase